MGRLRVSIGRLLQARAMTTAGAGAFSAGVWLEFGFGWSLMTAGAAAVAFGLLLVDIDQETK